MRSVAIQGTRGSYSEEAAVRLFGTAATIHGFSSFFETFQALLVKSVDYAVVPLRNTVVGEIRSAADYFGRTDLEIVDELPLPIRHALVGTRDAHLPDLRTARSHVEALRQCAGFFRTHPLIRPVTGADTAAGIRQIIAENISRNAAIGSPRAARLYGGKILLEDVADGRENRTTFYLIRNGRTFC